MSDPMHIEFLLETVQSSRDQPAVVWNDRSYTYGDLSERFSTWRSSFDTWGVWPGAVVGLEGDFSPNSIGLFLALVDRGCIVMPQSSLSRAGRERKDSIAQVEFYVRADSEDQVTWERLDRTAAHPLYAELRAREHPGLVLFSSGTSGEPKGAVHDLVPLLDKFRVPRTSLRTLNFLLFDHWGGLNTMLHTLANGAVVVTVRDRSPESVCALIEKHHVELLPSTPTFLNLLLLKGCHRDYDLSSMRVITYGAEPMPQSTLDRLRRSFPNVKLQQTYGLIEVGVLRSKSREDGSLWVKIGGEGYETRVVDGVLQIKTRSTILGYLNAPTPITEDGWFVTGDAVVQDGEYLLILGRKSEIINVGGEKVYPSEVESVIYSMDNVADVTVFGERNPFMGNIVCARVKLRKVQDPDEFVSKLKSFCRQRLERFKVPVKVQLVDTDQHGDRFKKVRRAGNPGVDPDGHTSSA
jgi:long-chain acyl-CoA synthetase